MKKPLLLPLLAFLVIHLPAVQIGDTLDQVLAERGKPDNRLQAGGTTILTYAEERIKLKNGKVVEMKAAGDTSISGSVKEVAGPPAVVAGQWSTDSRAALELAKNEDKKVFLFFTGSDWCGWCKRLEGEILTTPQFKNYATEKLVLVKLDFPHNLPQSDRVKAQNRALATKYAVSGFPTIIVLTSAGEKLGELGYMEGGPKGFLQKLEAL